MARSRPKASGSFRQDLSRLLNELGERPVIELGRPVPHEKYLPRERPGRCPATHNRLLLDEGAEP